MKLNKILTLTEAAVGSDIGIQRLIRTTADLHSFLDEHCSDAEWMWTEGRPIWRGFKSPLFDHNDGGIAAVIDPSATERQSQNTSNYYTLFFDNHPERAGWPKRSRSLIASRSEHRASMFTWSSNSVYAVIPFNGVKIGAVNALDMWDTLIGVEKFHAPKHRIYRANQEVWEVLFPHVSTVRWNDWLALDQNHEAVTKRIAEIREDFPTDPELGNVMQHIESEGLVNTIHAMYSNNNLVPQHTVHTSRDLISASADSEVWVGGPCVLIPAAAFNEFAG